MFHWYLTGQTQVSIKYQPTKLIHSIGHTTQLLVSRLLPAKRGCGRAVIIHYFIIISYDTMNTCTEQTLTSFKSGDAQTAQQMQ